MTSTKGHRLRMPSKSRETIEQRKAAGSGSSIVHSLGAFGHSAHSTRYLGNGIPHGNQLQNHQLFRPPHAGAKSWKVHVL